MWAQSTFPVEVSSIQLINTDQKRLLVWTIHIYIYPSIYGYAFIDAVVAVSLTQLDDD